MELYLDAPTKPSPSSFVAPAIFSYSGRPVDSSG